MRTIKADVIVVGGGPAGISASIAAHRSGAKVLLIEKNSHLGGNMVSGRPGALCGFYTSESEPKQIIKGIGGEMLEWLKKNDAVSDIVNFSKMIIHFYDLPMLKLAYHNMIKENGVELMLHSQVTDAKVIDNRIVTITLAAKPGFLKIEGKVFIDTTGDADLTYLSGAGYEKSDELQPGSMMYRVGNVDTKETSSFIRSGKLKEVVKQARSSNKYILTREDGVMLPTPHPGEMVIGFSHITVDGTDVFSLTKAEIEGNEHVQETFRFLKDKVSGFENAYLIDIACGVGIRETRRLRGLYTLTGNDIVSGAKFDDSVCRCAWPIEQHLQDGSQLCFPQDGDWYEIPYRCSIPLVTENLLVAGRCISSTREAQASCRVIAPSMAIGQSCGTAAALCSEHKVNPQDIDINRLQESLRKQGAYL